MDFTGDVKNKVMGNEINEISGQNCLSMHDIIKVLYLCAKAKKNVSLS